MQNGNLAYYWENVMVGKLVPRGRKHRLQVVADRMGLAIRCRRISPPLAVAERYPTKRITGGSSSIRTTGAARHVGPVDLIFLDSGLKPSTGDPGRPPDRRAAPELAEEEAAEAEGGYKTVEEALDRDDDRARRERKRLPSTIQSAESPTAKNQNHSRG